MEDFDTRKGSRTYMGYGLQPLVTLMCMRAEACSVHSVVFQCECKAVQNTTPCVPFDHY